MKSTKRNGATARGRLRAERAEETSSQSSTPLGICTVDAQPVAEALFEINERLWNVATDLSKAESGRAARELAPVVWDINATLTALTYGLSSEVRHASQ